MGLTSKEASVRPIAGESIAVRFHPPRRVWRPAVHKQIPQHLTALGECRESSALTSTAFATSSFMSRFPSDAAA